MPASRQARIEQAIAAAVDALAQGKRPEGALEGLSDDEMTEVLNGISKARDIVDAPPAPRLEPSLLQLLEVVARLAGDVAPNASAVEPHMVAIPAIHDRMRSSFGAVRLLASSGFADDAVSLTRQILVDSLVLDELAASDNARRAEIVIGMYLQTVNDLIGIEKETASQDGVEPPPDGPADLVAVKEALRRYATRMGCRLRPWKANDKHLATKHKRRDDYVSVLQAHLFVHGSAFALAARQSALAPDAVVIGGGAATTAIWAVPACVTAAKSVLLGSRALCAILETPEPPHVDELLHQVKAAGDAHAASLPN